MVQIDTGLYLEALPYIAEALMRNGSMAHDIEQIYKKHEAAYYTLYRNSTQNICERLITSGTLEREISLKHCLAVVLSAQQDENTKALLVKKIASNYPELFPLAKKASPKLYGWILKKCAGEKAEIANAFARLGYYFLVLVHGMEFEAAASIKDFIAAMESSFIEMRKYDHPDESLNRDITQHIKTVSKFLQNHQAIKSCGDIRMWMDAMDLPNRKDAFTNQDPKNAVPAMDLLREVYLLSAGLMDAKGLSFALLLEGHRLEKKDLQALAMHIHRIREKRKMSGKSLTGSEQDSLLYYTGIIFLSMLKEYNGAKILCNSRLDHEILVENQSLIRQNEQLERKNQALEQELFLLRQENAALQRKIGQEHTEAARQSELSALRGTVQALQAEKQKWETDQYDHSRLKELAFELDNPPVFVSSEHPDIHEILKKHRTFIFGGHETWHQQLRKALPELHLVSGTLHSVSPEVFQNAEYVLIFSGHMAHTVFDKGTAFLRKNGIPYGYLSQCNLELLKQKIAKIYEEEKQ